LQYDYDESNNSYVASANFPGVPNLPTDYAFPEFFATAFGTTTNTWRGQWAPLQASIQSASTMFLMSEHHYDSTYWVPWWITTTGVQGGPAQTKHFDGLNVLYADGHVKWLADNRWVGGATNSTTQDQAPNATVWPLYGTR
jgi:prepilin-type processing-associated H-X9-DG protein